MRLFQSSALRLAIPLALPWVMPASTLAADDTLEEVVVTASLRPQALSDFAASVSVLDAATLSEAGQQHFQDVIEMVPNLHWAGGTSRPRFFQMRGIGEREQYEGAPNPSVGFLIDDIDFSGLGMPATLFDVGQVEVLRGPQGTRYGANALAGLISVRGKDPEAEAHYSAEATLGDYGTRALGVAATAPVESLNSGWRLSLQKYQADGFMQNRYLGRDDTNNRDELTGRFKWRWQADSANTVDVTLLHANLNNGYDAWANDNTRNTLSDDPGQDAMRSNAAALKWNAQLQDTLQLTTIVTAADSHSVHAYDGDWGNAQTWQPYTYDYVYRADRYRSTRSGEVRLTQGDGSQPINWLAGVYVMNLRERIEEVSQGSYVDPFNPGYSGDTDDHLNSRYNAANTALYGQLDGRFASRWSWLLGARLERRTATYHDHRTSLYDAPSTLDQDARDTMWGASASLSYELSDAAMVYGLVSRGYKAGGFNLGSAAAAAPRFNDESLLNYEVGSKGQLWSRSLQYDVSLFYQKRRDMQVLDSTQLDPNDPNSFVFYTTNAGGGEGYGMEASLRARLSRAWETGGALGLLDTRVSSYRRADEVIPSRDQDNAPHYTASAYVLWRAAGWMARADASRNGGYYYSAAPSMNHSSPYTLVNLKAGYETSSWTVHGWVRNLFDKDYVVRAFEFGNQPPDFANALYVQHGDPRQVGVTATVSF